MSKKTVELPPATEDFKNLLDLMAVYTEANNRLLSLQAEANKEMMDILDENKAEYAEAQEAATKAESAMEVIALKHPEWFTKKKSIKTPFGVVKLTSGTKLDVANAEVSILLVEVLAEKEKALATAEGRAPAFTVEQLIRTEKALNKEALENLTDAQLEAFRIKRVAKESFSVTAASIDMGKAVTEAIETETQQAA